MAKLHQVLAAEKGVKADGYAVLNRVQHLIQKPALLMGVTRNYRPLTDGDVQLPPEVTRVQVRASDAIKDLTAVLTRMFDVVLTHEAANQVAKADVVVPGVGVLASQVPVTYLLYLEKQLIDLRTLVEHLPVLDPSEEWTFDTTTNSWRTPVTSSVRREKRKVVLVRYEATDKHPAQTEVYDDDVAVGTWDTVRESGALPQSAVNAMWERIGQVLEAVRVARQTANAIEVTQLEAGAVVLGYVFGGHVPAGTGWPSSDPGAKR